MQQDGSQLLEKRIPSPKVEWLSQIKEEKDNEIEDLKNEHKKEMEELRKEIESLKNLIVKSE